MKLKMNGHERVGLNDEWVVLHCWRDWSLWGMLSVLICQLAVIAGFAYWLIDQFNHYHVNPVIKGLTISVLVLMIIYSSGLLPIIVWGMPVWVRHRISLMRKGRLALTIDYHADADPRELKFEVTEDAKCLIIRELCGK